MAFAARSLSLLVATLVAVVAAPERLRADDKAPEAAPAHKAHTVVEKGSKVSIEYTLTADGKAAGSNVGKAPLQYEQGGGQMLPAFEAQLAGLTAGAKKEFDLTPEQGYGPVHKELYKTVDAAQLPEEGRKAGTVLMAQVEGGQRPVRVHEVNGDKVVLDLNHPLAGKKLHFAVKVLSVE